MIAPVWRARGAVDMTGPMSASQIPARALLERLVGFDTTSHKSNLALVEFVRAYLADHGVESTVLGDESGE